MMDRKEIKKLAVIGVGVVGANVAWACAGNGLEAFLYDISSKQLELALNRLEGWFHDGRISTDQAEQALARLHPCRTLAEAVSEVDLVFENVPENLELKKKVHAEIGRLTARHVLQGSNASSITCSPLAEASGRPDRFFNMNFSDPRHEYLVELMGNPRTSPATMAAAKKWARTIKMVPVVTQKEIMGYTCNRIWRAIKKECLFLLDQGYATVEDIDRSFMLSFMTEYGPCAIMDMVGLDTVRKIEWQYYLESGDERDKPPKMLNDMVEKGLLGQHVGRGFYAYPNPAYKQPGWLKMEPPWRDKEDESE